MTSWDPDKQRAAFKHALARAGYPSAAAIARVSGVPATTIRSYLNGQGESLSARTEQKISDATGLTLAQLYGEPSAPASRKVWVLGFVVEGGVVTQIEPKPASAGLREAASPFHSASAKGLYEVSPPLGLDPDQSYVAYELRGFAMPPAQDRWIVYFLRQDNSDIDTLLGSACVVHLTDGRILFRVIRRGYAPGRYNLEGWGGTDFIEDAQLIRAYPFVGCCRPDIAKA